MLSCRVIQIHYFKLIISIQFHIGKGVSQVGPVFNGGMFSSYLLNIEELNSQHQEEIFLALIKVSFPIKKLDKTLKHNAARYIP